MIAPFLTRVHTGVEKWGGNIGGSRGGLLGGGRTDLSPNSPNAGAEGLDGFGAECGPVVGGSGGGAEGRVSISWKSSQTFLKSWKKLLAASVIGEAELAGGTKPRSEDPLGPAVTDSLALIAAYTIKKLLNSV